jgi:small subunit ribosomal protein S11
MADDTPRDTPANETPAAPGSADPAAPAPKPAEGSPAPAAAGEAGAAAAKQGGAAGKKGRERGASDEVFLQIEGGEPEKPKILKAKGSKHVHSGVVHVLATFNNTIVTVTDRNGNVIGWSSAGKMGFKGSRKSTAYAAQLVSQDACRQAMGHGLKEAEVRVKGPGSGRESAVRAVQAIGIEITTIKDVTPVPHNGCRPPKPRRV